MRLGCIGITFLLMNISVSGISVPRIICSHELSISMICVVLNLLWIDSGGKRLYLGD